MKPDHQAAVRTIFIADDDEDDVYFVKTALASVNPEIKAQHFTKGDELIATLKNYIPDILFLDLDMPGANGLQCIQAIQSNPGTANLPIVIFSSTNQPSNVSTAYEIGAHLFFKKPSSFSALVSALNTILNLDWRNPDAIKERYFINGRYEAFA